MDYKTVFIVNSTKSDRIHLAKFIKHEKFTVMTFTALVDCYKRIGIINPDLIILALRRDSSELQQLQSIKDKHKKINYIILTTPETPEVNLIALKESGFTSIHKASSNEKVRELVIEMLAPDGLAPRTETPHPVPHGFIPTPTTSV